jgi:hypothetical protein
MNPNLVHLRVMGPPEAVEQVTRRLYDVLTVVEESDDRPNRSDAGVRRYLAVLVAAPERER